MICERCGKSGVSNLLYCEHCGERRFKAKIRLVEPTGRHNTLYVFVQDYVIGRDRKCDIFIDDHGVSRHHAKLRSSNGTFVIEDLESKNGVLINGKPLQGEAELHNYDCIQIGGAFIHFYYSEGDFPEERIFTHTGEFVQETLLKISREIQSKNMLDEVLNTILDGIMAMTQTREASLWLPSEEAGEWDLRIGRNLKAVGQGDLMTQRVRKLVHKIAEDGQYFIYHQNGHQEFVKDPQRIAGAPYRVLVVPLLSRKLFGKRKKTEHILGAIYLRAAGIARTLDAKKVGLLESLTSQAVVAIENNLLYSEALAKRKIDNELELARQIQNRLLPREIIQVPNTTIAGYSRARNYVGGDYYDVLKVRETELALVMSDISGKGVGAALVMSSLQGSLRAQLSYEKDPEHIVGNINQLVRESTAENVFATFFFCLYDYASGRLRYVNAGHNPPLVLKPEGGEIVLKSSAVPLGIIEQNSGREASVTLAPGDTVMFYTDGLTEAMNEKMKQLGLEEVKNAVTSFLKEKPDATAQEILDRILERVEEHVQKQPQHDDLTLLILKRV